MVFQSYKINIRIDSILIFLCDGICVVPAIEMSEEVRLQGCDRFGILHKHRRQWKLERKQLSNSMNHRRSCSHLLSLRPTRIGSNYFSLEGALGNSWVNQLSYLFCVCLTLETFNELFWVEISREKVVCDLSWDGPSPSEMIVCGRPGACGSPWKLRQCCILQHKYKIRIQLRSVLAPSPLFLSRIILDYTVELSKSSLFIA